MKIEKITFCGWKNCIEITNRKFRLVATTEVYDTNILPTQLIFSALNFTETYQITSIFLGLVFGIPVVFAIIGIIVHRRRKFL